VLTNNCMSTVATYNARDQLLTYGQNSYTWTVDGGLATKTTPSGTTNYTWNALGELTDVTLSDGTVIHYLYDGMGRRVGKEKNGTLVAGYLYAGSRIVAETDATGQVAERFVYVTRVNVPDYMVTYSGGSATGTYRIVYNQVGSVREVIDATTGVVAQQIDYDVWGNITNDTNPGFQPFAFAGGLYDSDTDLVHFGARDYDPETGRWISRDPILFAGGDPNLYRYVVDDPVNGFDRLGLQGGWGGIANTLTNGNAQTMTAQNLAAMAAENQAQKLAGASEVKEAQCIGNLLRQNFNYYDSAVPNFVKQQDPFRTIPSMVSEVGQNGVMWELTAYTKLKTYNERMAGNFAAAEDAARFGKFVRVSGGFGEFAMAVGVGTDLGAGIDAVGATVGSLGNCPCQGGQ